MAALSVLMSIYIKEKPEYAEEAFNSLLRQTVKADEWVIVEDGPLTKELYELLERYQKENPGLIKRVKLEKNQGLGAALRTGVPECSNDLIARMDTDDISREDRFEKQLVFFKKNPETDICGTYISEFEGDPENIVAKRTVPVDHNDIVKYQKRRDAFNHVSVMFKKSAVLKAGNYQSCPLMEDTYLWSRMIMNGAKCANIPECLVNVRIGRDMFERRGGLQYLKKYAAGRKQVLLTGYISRWDYFITVAAQCVVALVPGKLRRFIFERMLHK